MVNGTTLTLTYNEDLDETSEPATSAYTVSGSHSVTGVDVVGRTVELTLNPAVTYEETGITVSYTNPGTSNNPVKDEAGNEAANLTNELVQNDTPDTTRPVFDFATVSGATLTLTYDEELNSTSRPVTTAFTVSGSNGSHPVTGVNVVGATVVLTLNPAVAFEETGVTVSYTNPGTNPIEDLAGNDADNLTNEDVANDTPDPDQTGPVLQTREVNGAALTLTYNEDLDSTSVPDGGAYTVTVNGSSVAVDDVSVGGKVVSLTLSTAVVHGDVVTVAYNVPGSNPVRDDSENENNAASFSARSVTNNTEFVDTVPPELVGASVNRATLFLTYDEGLNGSKPGPGAYTVTVNGVDVQDGVSAVSSVSGQVVTLVLATAVERVDEVKISYAKPTTGSVIEDDAGTPNAAESFDDYDVTNNTPRDTVPPRIRHAFVNGDKLTLTYNEALDRNSVPATTAYTVKVNDGAGPTVSRVLVSTVSVVLTLETAVDASDIVTLDYEAPTSSPVRDTTWNPAGDLTNYAVTNNTSGNGDTEDGNTREFISHMDALKAQGYWPVDINDDLIDDVRTRIYIELARELKADETPLVFLPGGGIHDLAGNTNESQDVTPRDGIAPRFTVTVTGAAQDRPVANARGEFVVDVRADEDLRRRPVVYFTDIEAEEGKKADGTTGTGEYLYSTGSNVQTGGSLAEQVDDDHWAGTYTVSGLNAFDELFGLVVYGFDYEDNIGESGGWTLPGTRETPDVGPPTPDDDLDLTEMDEAGVLLEIDRQFNDGAEPEHAVTPSRRLRNDETESANPFLSINFKAEGSEYAVCPTDGCGDANPEAEVSDSHATVDITAISLNGRNAMSMLARVSAGRFALVMNGLELGDYEIEYMAVDDAGNVGTFDFEFSVLERTPYELAVSPGWNLISFPGTPLDPSLGGVIPSGGRVSPVLAYQNGDWLTAVESADGEWGGNLTQFEAGFGYWLFATTYTALNPVIPDPEQTSTPPSVQVEHGWNLLGVIDLFQNAAGTPPGANGGDGEADGYFGSIPWRIAYTYDTVYARWVKAVPGADTNAPEDADADEAGYREVVTKAAVTDADGNETAPAETKVVTQEILNGKGYWVWSAEPGTLVP